MTGLIPFVRRHALNDFNDWVYDFDKLMEPFTAPTQSFLRMQGDVHETDENIVMSFDFPGMKEEDIKIALEGDVLTITGERRKEESFGNGKNGNGKNGSGATQSFYGRQYGKFQRSFSLPENIDKKNIDADYRDGVLRVLLPKVEPKKEDVVDIKVKSKNSVFDRLLGSK